MRKHAPFPMARWIFTKLFFHMAFVFQFILLLCSSFLLWMLHLVSSSLMHGGRSLVACQSGCLSIMGIWLPWMSFFTCIVWSLPPIIGILKFYLGIGSLESSVASLLPFVTRSHDIFFISGSRWETMSDDLWDEVLWFLWKWEILSFGASLSFSSLNRLF